MRNSTKSSERELPGNSAEPTNDRTGWEHCAILREGTSGTAIVAHGIYGNDIGPWHPVVWAFPDGWQVLGLSIESGERVESFATPTDVIDAHLANVMEHDLHGPVVLYGFSMGGMIAWDLGCRLVNLGYPVARVIVGDTLPLPVLDRLPKPTGVARLSFELRRSKYRLRFRVVRARHDPKKELRRILRTTPIVNRFVSKPKPTWLQPEPKRIEDAFYVIGPQWRPSKGSMDVHVIASEGNRERQQELWCTATTGSIAIEELAASTHIDLATVRVLDVAAIIKRLVR